MVAAVKSPGANGVPRRWSMFTQSGVVGGEFVPVERGVVLRDDRPCVARGRPLRRRGIGRRVPRRRRRCRRGRTRRPPRSARRRRSRRCVAHRCGTPRGSPPFNRDTTKGEALPADRNDGRHYVPEPDVGDRPHVGDGGIPTVSDPGAHDTTTIVAGDVVGHISAMASQSRAAKHVQKRSYTWLAAFSSRGGLGPSSSKRASAASMSASSKTARSG